MSGTPTSRDSSLARFTATAEQAANRVIASYSTSFGLATRMLGRRHRQHVRNIYAMVRVADEIVDGVAAESGLSVAQQRAELERYREEAHRAMRNGYSSDLVLHAFALTARASRIDESLTQPFFDSMAADLGEHPDAAAGETEGSPSAAVHRSDDALHGAAPASRHVYDAEEHARYVHGSAEVVGLMCLRVFVRDETASNEDAQRLEHGASRLGAAFQNINFLRDLADDTDRLGRHYLGTAERMTEADRLEWVRTVRAQLDDARAVIPLLPRDARAAVHSAHALFSALADKVERTPVDDLYRTRVRVSDPAKAYLATRSLVTTRLERAR
jgi:phytoene/squalene synthetase